MFNILLVNWFTMLHVNHHKIQYKTVIRSSFCRVFIAIAWCKLTKLSRNQTRISLFRP